jgi:hypothetical protein
MCVFGWIILKKKFKKQIITNFVKIKKKNKKNENIKINAKKYFF